MTKTEILRHTEQEDRTRAQENDSESCGFQVMEKPEYFLHFVPRLQEYLPIPDSFRLLLWI